MSAEHSVVDPRCDSERQRNRFEAVHAVDNTAERQGRSKERPSHPQRRKTREGLWSSRRNRSRVVRHQSRARSSFVPYAVRRLPSFNCADAGGARVRSPRRGVERSRGCPCRGSVAQIDEKHLSRRERWRSQGLRRERAIARRGGSPRQGGHVRVGRSGCRANARERTVSV